MRDRHTADEFRLAKIHLAISKAAADEKLSIRKDSIDALAIVTSAADLWEEKLGEMRPRSQESTESFLASLRQSHGWAFDPPATTSSSKETAPPRRATAAELLERANEEFQKKKTIQ